jgi:hypothetical protein
MSPSLSKSLTFCLFGLALPLLGCATFVIEVLNQDGLSVLTPHIVAAR